MNQPATEGIASGHGFAPLIPGAPCSSVGAANPAHRAGPVWRRLARRVALVIGLLLPITPALVCAAQNSAASAEAASTLQGVVPGPAELSPAEKELIDKASKDEVADYCEPSDNDPAKGATWGPERTIRAEVLRDLASGENPAWRVGTKGIRVKCAKIVGDFDFTARKIDRPLELEQSYIEEQIVLDNASAFSISLNGSYAAKGIHADELHTDHDLSLGAGFVANGPVWIGGATIDGDLVLSGGRFLNPGGQALFADRIHVRGDVFFLMSDPQHGQFTATGEVRLLEAEIGGDLDASGGNFKNPKGDALSLDGIHVKGGVFLTSDSQHGRFSATGEVRLPGADIGGDLNASGGQFENLTADRIHVKGNVFLQDGFSATGAVRLAGAQIDGQLGFVRADLSRATVDLEEARIGASFWFKGIAKASSATSIDLRGAEAGRLVDDPQSWGLSDEPQHQWKLKEVDLDGFKYKTLFDPWENVEDRKAWLRRLPGFYPQPYAQLAAVLRQMGRERDARGILSEEREEQARFGALTPFERFGDRLAYVTVRYGYAPWRAVGWIVLFLILGTGFAYAADKSGIVMRSPEDAGPRGAEVARSEFNAFLYSLDVFVPGVDFHQKKYFWLTPPSGRAWYLTGWYWVSQFYFIIHALAAWVLAAIIAAAVTGLLKT